MKFSMLEIVINKSAPKKHVRLRVRFGKRRVIPITLRSLAHWCKNWINRLTFYSAEKSQNLNPFFETVRFETYVDHGFRDL